MMHTIDTTLGVIFALNLLLLVIVIIGIIRNILPVVPGWLVRLFRPASRANPIQQYIISVYIEHNGKRIKLEEKSGGTAFAVHSDGIFLTASHCLIPEFLSDKAGAIIERHGISTHDLATGTAKVCFKLHLVHSFKWHKLFSITVKEPVAFSHAIDEDSCCDKAVLAIPAYSGIAALTISTEERHPEDITVSCVGYPSYSNSLSVSRHRLSYPAPIISIDGHSWVLTKGGVMRGMSGGPALLSDGTVLGIIKSKDKESLYVEPLADFYLNDAIGKHIQKPSKLLALRRSLQGAQRIGANVSRY